MEASNSQPFANICNVCWCMRNACTVTASHARHVFRAVVPVSDVSRVLADMFVAYGCMAVYSQQPTKCWAPKSSWCISSMVASQTDCQQVESCSLQGTAPIFLALWVAYDPLGQTMEASNSQSFANICNVCWSMRNACTVTACHGQTCLSCCSSCFRCEPCFGRHVCCIRMHGCVFSAAHQVLGTKVVMVYILNGGVPNRLPAS